MTNTPDEVDAYARAHPTNNGGSWAGWCAAFCYRAGGFTRFFPNAMTAGSSSGPLNPDHTQAGRGAIHYWAGVGGDGHCAFDMGGNLLLMASNAVSNYGTALGTISFADYATKGLPYRGWSYQWGNETLDLTSSASSGTTPFPSDPTTQEDDDMKPIVVARVDSNGNPTEWSLVAPWITGADGKTKGYRVTTESATGAAWGRLYGIQGVPNVRIGRDGYVKIQAEASVLFDLWAANK